MAIDDIAGRRAVRERRSRHSLTESVFVDIPRGSLHSRTPIVLVRDDVHERGIAAARKALRAARQGLVSGKP